MAFKSESIIAERMCPSQDPIAEVAYQYLQAGLSVIPIRPDASKAPALASWKPFQRQRMSFDEAKRVFLPGVGIAVICGDVSGNLTCLDFDEPGLYAGWRLRVSTTDDAALLDRLVVCETPSGGHHVYFRYRRMAGRSPGNEKLALNEDLSTRIETRAEGGYCIVPPSPTACHPDRKPYTFVQGDLMALSFISEDERNRLLEYARVFDLAEHRETPERVTQGRTEASGQDGPRPGDDFNSRSSWPEILEPLGWQQAAHHGSLVYWVRPGKSHGTSATTGVGNNRLRVHTTNGGPLEPRKGGYDLFGAYAAIHHGGDISAAAKDLGGQGYGSELRPVTTRTQPKSAVTQVAGEDTPTQPEKGLSEIASIVAKELNTLPVQVKPMGLILSPEMSEKQKAMGLQRLLKIHKEATNLLKFGLGDLWNSLPDAWGEKLAWTKKNRLSGNYQMLRNCGSIAGGWPLERRVEGVPWAFYELTRKLSVADQNFYLARYLRHEDGFNTGQLAEELEERGLKGKKTNASTPRWKADADALTSAHGEAFVEKLMTALSATKPLDQADSAEADRRLALAYKIIASARREGL